MTSPFVHDHVYEPDSYAGNRCLRVGVLTNPLSGGNKKGDGT